MIHSRPDYQRIQDPAGKIPDNEPVFLFRAQDKYAPIAVNAWADALESDGGDKVLVSSARAHARKMQEWENKKSPDPEDWGTINKRRGELICQKYTDGGITEQEVGELEIYQEYTRHACGDSDPHRMSYVYEMEQWLLDANAVDDPNDHSMPSTDEIEARRKSKEGLTSHEIVLQALANDGDMPESKLRRKVFGLIQPGTLATIIFDLEELGLVEVWQKVARDTKTLDRYIELTQEGKDIWFEVCRAKSTIANQGLA